MLTQFKDVKATEPVLLSRGGSGQNAPAVNDDQQAAEKLPTFNQDSDMRNYLYELLAAYY